MSIAATIAVALLTIGCCWGIVRHHLRELFDHHVDQAIAAGNNQPLEPPRVNPRYTSEPVWIPSDDPNPIYTDLLATTEAARFNPNAVDWTRPATRREDI